MWEGGTFQKCNWWHHPSRIKAAFSKKLSTQDGNFEEQSASRSRESIGGRGLRSEMVKDRAVVVSRARSRKKSIQVGANECEVARGCLTSAQTERGKLGHGCLALNEAKRGLSV